MKNASPGRGAAAACLILVAMLTGCEEGRGPYYECIHAGPILEYTYIRDYEFARYRLFDLGVVRDPAGDTSIRFLFPGDVIRNLRVYQQVDDAAAQAGIAYPYWPDKTREGLMDKRVTTRFRDVTASTSVNHNASSLYLYSTIPASAVEGAALAYYVEIRRGTADTIGDIRGDTLQLQLLKFPHPEPSDPLWEVEWKNAYRIDQLFVSFDDVEIDIFKGMPGTEESGLNLNHQNTVPYLQLLGLDQTGGAGTEGFPDGTFDWEYLRRYGDYYFLTFPDARPFDSDTGYAGRDPDSVLHDRVPLIYNSAIESERENATRYYIAVGIWSHPGVITLDRADIIPYSETVTLNGTQLTPDRHYQMNYDTGTIRLRPDIAMHPDLDLTICYEYGP